MLGLCFAYGNGVAKDWAQAVHWYEKAALSGQVDAQVMLGECFINGNGVTQDMAQAVHWYEKAAAAGNAGAQACLSELRVERAAGAAATLDPKRASE